MKDILTGAGILPEVKNLETLVNALPSPIMMNIGESWEDNLVLSPISNPQTLINKVSSQQKVRRFVQQHFYEICYQNCQQVNLSYFQSQYPLMN